jgi:hypothetical protein
MRVSVENREPQTARFSSADPGAGLWRHAIAVWHRLTSSAPMLS